MNFARLNLRDIPAPDQIRAVREAIGLTQTLAGESIFRGLRTWQNWEYGERTMPLDTWLFFLLIHDVGTVEEVQAAATKGKREPEPA